MNQSAATRYCFYNPKGGLLSIKLTVSNNIICGSDFKLYDENKTKVLEQFKLSAESNVAGVKRIQSLLTTLKKSNLVWAIVCCSKNPNIYSGDVKIEVFQDENALKMNFPAEKHLVNIPPCSTNSTESYKGMLVFIPKE